MSLLLRWSTTVQLPPRCGWHRNTSAGTQFLTSFTKSQSAITSWLYYDFGYQHLLILNQNCWSYFKTYQKVWFHETQCRLTFWHFAWHCDIRLVSRTMGQTCDTMFSTACLVLLGWNQQQKPEISWKQTRSNIWFDRHVKSWQWPSTFWPQNEIISLMSQDAMLTSLVKIQLRTWRKTILTWYSRTTSGRNSNRDLKMRLKKNNKFIP